MKKYWVTTYYENDFLIPREVQYDLSSWINGLVRSSLIMQFNGVNIFGVVFGIRRSRASIVQYFEIDELHNFGLWTSHDLLKDIRKIII